jgi:hypothetical protein
VSLHGSNATGVETARWAEERSKYPVSSGSNREDIVNGVADRVRTEMYRNIGLSDLLMPIIS